jgi:hypothetical protein
MFMGHRFAQFWFQNMFSRLQATPKNRGGMCSQPKLIDYEYMWDKGHDF